MTDRGVKSFISVCISATILYFIIGINIDFKSAWLVVSNLTHFVPFIITGVICLILGINERKLGSNIFAIVTLILLVGAIW